ncbi:MAG: SPASM domain-containing protein [Candidatus Omnitrophica bacterium]|nr:SPASM domain-containing protein [Candidatus Omnitrophota bacterium]
MKKILILCYSPDPHLLEFWFKKIRRQEPEAGLSLLLRHSLGEHAKALPSVRNCWTFPQESSRKVGRVKDIFSAAVLDPVRAQGFDELICFTGGLQGLKQAVWMQFALRTRIPKARFVESNGVERVLEQKDLQREWWRVRTNIKGEKHFLFSNWSMRMGHTKSLGIPTNYTIEPTNVCNLKCPICKTGIGTIERAQGIMSLELYRTVLDKIGKYANNILLYGTGEPFLNKNIYEMIRLAKARGIVVTMASNGTMFDAEQVVRSGLDELGIAIGGVTQETHSVYRVGGDLDLVLSNIRALVAAKKKLGSQTPRVLVDFVVQKHNQHQVDEVVDLALEMEVDSLFVCPTIVWDMGQANRFVSDDPQFSRYDAEAMAEGRLVPKDGAQRCALPWFSSLIQWNGKVSPCCGIELPRRADNGQGLTHAYDPLTYPLGDLSEEGVTWESIWNGPKYQKFREVFLSSEGASICKLCSGYDAPPLRKAEGQIMDQIPTEIDEAISAGDPLPVSSI